MKRRIVKILAFIIIFGVIGSFIFSQMKQSGILANESPETSLLQERIVKLSEWTTLKYEYSKAIVSREEKNIPLTDFNYAESIKLIEYSGYLEAGSDLSKLKVSHNKVSKQILIRVPKAQILDNVVDTEKTKITDVKGNIFFDPPTQKIIDELNTNKKEIEKEKIKKGFLDEADKRTKELLISFLSSMGQEDVIIEFY